jgi:hypothetical protein
VHEAESHFVDGANLNVTLIHEGFGSDMLEDRGCVDSVTDTGRSRVVGHIVDTPGPTNGCSGRAEKSRIVQR